MRTAINKKGLLHVLSLFLCLLIFFLSGCNTNPVPAPPPEQTNNDQRGLTPQQYSMYNLAGTDMLGRPLEAVDGEKADKTRYVGLFYFVWLGQHKLEQDGIYDISKLERDNNEALFGTDNALSPAERFHFWGEPLYGYYNSLDPWVVVKHLELLTLAGVDYLAIDATNSFYYPDVVRLLIEKVRMFQEQGWDVPKLMFYTNSSSGSTVTKIYETFYRSGDNDDVWFAPEGKPMLVGYSQHNNTSDQTYYSNLTDFVSPGLIEYFDFKESQWPNVPSGEDTFPWMSWKKTQDIHNGTISVSVAQHSQRTITFSDKQNAWGRGFVHGDGNDTERSDFGSNIQNQWQTVFDNDDKVDNVFLTGWNEWIAIKQVNSKNEVFFVDCFNEEFSRDIEMSKTGYLDSFYMQMADNIRKYKFTPAVSYDMPQMQMDITNQRMPQWQYVQAHYKDFEFDAVNRNFRNFAGTFNYVDDTARNDLTDVKVIHDGTNIYFLINTLDDITGYQAGDDGWMNLRISTGSSEYLINRKPDGAKTTIERITPNGFVSTGSADYNLFANNLILSVPLSAVGISGKVTFNFKVSDNVTDPGNVMNFYTTGDSMPAGRLEFVYGY